MAKFVIECPVCGKYAEAKTGFFAKKKIDCSCGNVIDVRTDKLTGRECPHCGNMVVFDQSKGKDAKCPVCGEPINTMAEQNKTAEFSCRQCGVRLRTSKAAAQYVCPVCDFENDVRERLMSESIRKDGLASIIKYEGDADALVWKHPIEDFNLGSQLIVHESQEAIFFRDGQALDLFGAGRYTLETQQLPMLEKFYQLPTDTEGTFHSEVYFFNLMHQMAVKWGTPNKVTLIDPLTDAPMQVGARGLLNFRIADSRKLLLKLVGTTGGLNRDDLMGDSNSYIKDYFRSLIQTSVATNLGAVIRQDNIDILQIDLYKLALSETLKAQIQPYFADYGITITELLVEGIVLPQKGELGYDSLQTIIELRQKKLTKAAIEHRADIEMAEQEAQKRVELQRQAIAAEVEVAHRGVVSEKGATDVLEAQLAGQKHVAEVSAETTADRLRLQLEMERKQQMAQIEAEEMRAKGFNQRDVLQAEVQKAYAEGIGNMGPAVSGGGGSGIVGDLMGLGVGMAAASAIAPQLGNMMQGMNPQQSAPAVPQPAPGVWTCTACGQAGITSNFCPNCGAKRPMPTAQVGWNCACGQTGITSNFCPNCGAKKPAANTWDCACGQKNITSNFCPNCGTKREG